MEVYLLRQDVASIFLFNLWVQYSFDTREVPNVRKVHQEEGHAGQEVKHDGHQLQRVDALI